jgi:hypothetical protein
MKCHKVEASVLFTGGKEKWKKVLQAIFQGQLMMF